MPTAEAAEIDTRRNRARLSGNVVCMGLLEGSFTPESDEILSSGRNSLIGILNEGSSMQLLPLINHVCKPCLNRHA